MKLTNFCFTCGGHGFLDKTCSECGREPKKISFNLDKKDNVPELMKKVEGIEIPNYYHGISWSRGLLEHDHKDKLSKKFGIEGGLDDLLFVKYCDQLEKIHSIYASGQIPHKSAIIIAPAGYSKITFAYSCMQHALNAGFTVAPLLDTVEVKRALLLASENVNYKINKRYSYDDYILSDVMFVTVTKLYARNEAYAIIEELFDRRSRKGLSTFFLSRFDLNELAKCDYSRNFQA